jgi:hypothetical protein
MEGGRGGGRSGLEWLYARRRRAVSRVNIPPEFPEFEPDLSATPAVAGQIGIRHPVVPLARPPPPPDSHPSRLAARVRCGARTRPVRHCLVGGTSDMNAPPHTHTCNSIAPRNGMQESQCISPFPTPPRCRCGRGRGSVRVCMRAETVTQSGHAPWYGSHGTPAAAWRQDVVVRGNLHKAVPSPCYMCGGCFNCHVHRSAKPLNSLAFL